jgi:SAM-dependent methyltransferase
VTMLMRPFRRIVCVSGRRSEFYITRGPNGGQIMKSRDKFGYNERLFSGWLRKHLHLARFRWVIKQISKLRCPYDSVLELGCYDGKLIDFFPKKPMRYKGFDANWERGLDQAKEKWKMYGNYSFFKASIPEDMPFEERERFDIAVIMETLEHVPPDLVDGYLKKVAEHIAGYLFITIPNEKGIVFLIKWIMKRLFSNDAEKYSFNELLNASLGRMHLVERREKCHKGFDYISLVRQVEEYFELISVSGHPYGFLPTSLCYGVGVVAKSRICEAATK